MQETSSGAATEEPHTSSRPEDLSVASGFSADTFNPNRTPSETSFVPAQAAVSSTPAATVARTRGTNDTSTLPPGTDPSWGMSLESPLVRLERELCEFARADPQPASTSTSSDLFSEADLTVGNIAAVAAEETVHAAPTPASAPGPSSTRVMRPTVQTHEVPPLSFRRNPATPARNPYIPVHSDPHNWSGIVDLRSTRPLAPTFSAAGTEEDEPTLPAGMSPPVMVPFATLPSLGRSPVRAAAENIRHALVRDALRDGGGDSIVSANATGSSMIPTPPSLTRYMRSTSASQNSSSSLRAPDLELESMIRHVQDPSQPHWWRSSAVSSTSSTSIPDGPLSTPSYYTTPAPSTHAHAHETVLALPEMPLPTPSGVTLPVPGGDAETTTDAMPESDDTSASTSTFSSSGEDSVHNTAHPSAAFLLASRQRGTHDYDDDEDDELDHDDDFDDSLDAAGDAGAGIAPVHPFARVRASAYGEDDDDSFDSLEGGEEEEVPEETVFGLRPAERDEAARLQPQLRMYGEELLEDTMGIGTRLARAGRIEESPTPWGTGGGGRSG